MALEADYYDYRLAIDPVAGVVVPNATAQVYDVSDTTFSSPLSITDVTGTPLSLLQASPTGVLPQFMVPAQFVSLKTFPLTPNGKIDRKALPTPDELERSERKFLAPRNHDEEQLAKIWTEVLRLEKVGVEENFFDLGGNSLQAMQLIARLRTDLAVDPDVSTIFLAPTPADLAALLRTKHGLVDHPLDGPNPKPGRPGVDEPTADGKLLVKFVRPGRAEVLREVWDRVP